MALYALDDVDDAVDATRRFLLPFDRVRWLRLAVVMFFVGGVGGFSFPGVPGNFGGDAQPDGADAPPTDIAPALTDGLVALIVAVVAVVLLLGLGYMLVSAIMEFVFVDSLRREEVRLRAFFKRHWRKGGRLFVFRLGVQLLSVALIAAILLGAGAALGGWPPTAWSDGTVLAVILLALPVLFLFALVVGNLLGFTTVFVVPVMLREDRGVISAWRRFWPTLVGQWKQYLVYAIMGFLLSIAVGIAVGFAGLIVAVALAIPFLVVGIPLVVVLGLGSGVGSAIALVLVLLYVVLLLVAGLLIQAPFQTFLRYYALFVLGDTNDDFDVIPDARRAVRADGGVDEEGDGGDGTGSSDLDGPGAGTGDADGPSDGGDGDRNVDRDDRFDRE